ncbi:MAG: DNA repair protein RecN [Ruminococcaceae bacterium]|nr:DNA repair protein RecN [Oscillospiraceae bacterium]
MLLSVYIENIALIKRLSLEPSCGFCAFTGETGAGKSIIIDSLGLLCGARSDKDIIRTGEDEALVEGIFTVENSKTEAFLKELDICPEEDGSITVTRKISKDGRSTAKINGRTVPLSRLKTAMAQLLSIHGQQDTQAFADSERQLYMLDSFADNEAVFNEYKNRFDEYTNIKKRLDSLNDDSKDREARLDMLRFRLTELKSAKVLKGEKEDLQTERKRLANSEKIISRAGEAYNALYNRDGAAVESVNLAYNAISALEGIIPEAEELSARLESAKYELLDISDSIKDYLESDGENVDRRLDDCESRLELIKKLESKYKVSADEFSDLIAEWQAELDLDENSEEEKARLEAELKKAEKNLVSAAKALTETRKNASVSLCARMTEELNELDMPGVRFEAELIPTEEYTSHGFEDVEFLISANKGETPKPMAKIASGGELSRIMLCLKCVFAHTEAIGTLIFDEIDTGVSGKTSEKIGIRLRKASDGGKTQVICVTHSAILASKADAHYKISKQETENRTVTNVEKLDFNGRRDELARIMGGVNITETVIAAAEEMLKNE